MAHLLKKEHGFTNVVVLELSDHVGGKSLSVPIPNSGEPDVFHEVGTCFMHPGYNRIFQLMQDYNVVYHKMGGPKYGSKSPFFYDSNIIILLFSSMLL